MQHAPADLLLSAPVPPQGLETFLQAASSDPDTVLHYEFMQVGGACAAGPDLGLNQGAASGAPLPMPHHQRPLCGTGCPAPPVLHPQDYKVHIKHTDGSFEYVPYFCLPGGWEGHCPSSWRRRGSWPVAVDAEAPRALSTPTACTACNVWPINLQPSFPQRWPQACPVPPLYPPQPRTSMT